MAVVMNMLVSKVRLNADSSSRIALDMQRLSSTCNYTVYTVASCYTYWLVVAVTSAVYLVAIGCGEAEGVSRHMSSLIVMEDVDGWHQQFVYSN